MAPRKNRALRGSKPVTRSQSKDINPYPSAEPEPEPEQQQPQQSADSHDSLPPHSYPPRRHAPPARPKGRKVMAMGSLPPGPSSSATTSLPGKSPNTATMVFFKDMLLDKAQKLVSHLGDPKRDEMWPVIAKILNHELETTRESYLDKDHVFVDSPVIATKIAREKTEAIAAAVAKAAYTANLAALLYLCNQFKSSTEPDMLVNLLDPLDQTFPSSFVVHDEKSKDGGQDVQLAIEIRSFRALVVIGEEIKAGRSHGQLLEKITSIFFGMQDEEVMTYIDSESIPPKSFAGIQPDWYQVEDQARRLVDLVENSHEGVMQEISKYKLSFLDNLEIWAREALERLDGGGDEAVIQAEARQMQAQQEQQEQEQQEQEQQGGSTEDSSDESDSASSNDIVPPHVISAALEDGPPGRSPSQNSQQDEAPPDYGEIHLPEIRASGVAASRKRQRSLKPLSKIAEESEGAPMAGYEDDEDDAFETDHPEPGPKRPRVDPSRGGRRPLPGGRSSAAASATHPPDARANGSSPGSKRRGGTQVQAGAAPSSHGASSAPRPAGGEEKDYPSDLTTVRNENSQQRLVKARKPNVQYRVPWGRDDELRLIKAVAFHSAGWSNIAKRTEFEVPRDQQQVRDKARNLKVDFLLGDLPLPPGFDYVALGPKEKTKAMSMGKNPDRQVEDYDEETGRITNNLYVGDD